MALHFSGWPTPLCNIKENVNGNLLTYSFKSANQKRAAGKTYFEYIIRY